MIVMSAVRRRIPMCNAEIRSPEIHLTLKYTLFFFMCPSVLMKTKQYTKQTKKNITLSVSISLIHKFIVYRKTATTTT